MFKKLLGAATAVAAAIALLHSPAAHAQESAASYPSRTIKLIAPFTVGGNVDIVARLLAQKLSEELKQTVVVENPLGASGAIGAAQVARAAPDGYTLLVNASIHVIIPSLFAKLPYDAITDFVPVSQVTDVPLMLVANPQAPFDNVPAFVSWGKAQPKGVSYASSGVGSPLHLATALFGFSSGIDLVQVPYKGSSAAQVDVISGQIPVMFDATTGLTGPLQAGQLKPLAIAAKKRSVNFPKVPTFAEAGYPEVDLSTWHGVYAPAKTPRPVIDKLNAALVKIARSPDFAERLRALGAESIGSSPEAFLAYNKTELAKWAAIAQKTGARLEN